MRQLLAWCGQRAIESQAASEEKADAEKQKTNGRQKTSSKSATALRSRNQNARKIGKPMKMAESLLVVL
jgi:hypothetical protein